jgi:hypothetical protein
MCNVFFLCVNVSNHCSIGFLLDFFYLYSKHLFCMLTMICTKIMAHIKLISNARSHTYISYPPPPPQPLRISIDYRPVCSLQSTSPYYYPYICLQYAVQYTHSTALGGGGFGLRWTRSVRNPENERRTRASEMSPRLTGSMHVCMCAL